MFVYYIASFVFLLINILYSLRAESACCVQWCGNPFISNNFVCVQFENVLQPDLTDVNKVK